MDKPNLNFEALQKQIETALLSVDRLRVEKILTQPYHGYSSTKLIEKLVVPALESIGAGWETGQYSLSQVYMSGRICEEIIDLILPPTGQTHRHQPKTAIVVLEDYHMLGKRIVYSTLRAGGFELENYGRMNVEELIERVQLDQVKILLISVLMLPAALRIKDLRERLVQTGSDIKLVVGGAPFRFDKQLWREVGADAVGSSASEALNIINRMVEEIS